MKKKMLEQKLEWATAQVYCKRKGFCIAIQSCITNWKGLSRLGIVLQD